MYGCGLYVSVFGIPPLAQNFSCLSIYFAFEYKILKEISFHAVCYLYEYTGFQLELPDQDNETSDLIRTFITNLNDQRPYPATLLILRQVYLHLNKQMNCTKIILFLRVTFSLNQVWFLSLSSSLTLTANVISSDEFANVLLIHKYT